MKNVLVAMSGGVDSAVAALLLQNQGYAVGGITMRLLNGDESVPDENCTDARAIADKLGFVHHTVSYCEDFRKDVIDRFISDYKNGLTPNPCVECNKKIKFGALWQTARELGYEALATGHYAKIEKDANGEYRLLKADDEKKDQSYFLWSLKKELLPYIIFPLGGYTKPEIRKIAESNGFVNAHRSDSQDICFIKDGDYASFIRQNCGCSFPAGEFTDINGNIIGRHSGIINYTVGQRKGLGMAFGVPMFVGKKNAAENTVTLCTDEQLYGKTLTAKNINLLSDESFEAPIKLQAKIRYRHTPAAATVTQTGDDELTVVFDTAQRAIAPGQSLVLYDGDRVIGGGIIQ